MKSKIIIGVVSFVLLVVGSIATYGALDKTYELVADEFVTEVAVNDELNYENVYIVETNMYGSKNVTVSKSMIVSGNDTSTIGNKTLTIEYDKQQFTIDYKVKYKIQFIINGELVSTQLVNNRSELNIPTNPTKPGNEFLGWTPELPEIITKNTVFEANFSDKPQEVPELKPLLATYGDKLSTIELPSNQYGAWKFVDSIDNTVGNAGKNRFQVQFWPTNQELAKIDGEVTIEVAKKELEFKNLVVEFEYDGQSHKPTFSLDVDVRVDYFGPNPTEIGDYVFTLEIVDDNYKGYYAGSFKITKPSVTITVLDAEMVLGESIPEIQYTVEGLDDYSDLGIKVIKPTILHAGTYTLTVSWTNTNYKVKVIEGTLTVKKANMELIDPEFVTTAVYGSKLSTVEFDNINPGGTWTWKNVDTIISTPTEFKAVAVFTPNDLDDYEIIEKELTIKVEKKELSIVLDGEGTSAYTFDYDGTAKHILVKVEDGSYTDVKVVIVYQDETITSHPINAGSYYCTAKIEDDRYKGSFSSYLNINKINPALENGEFFSQTYSVNWNTYLNAITLPEGYTWNRPTTQLTLIGEQEFEATYTPEDIVNYNILTGKFTVTVNKLQGTLRGVAETYTRNYTGEIHTLTGIYSNHSEVEVVFEYVLNGVKVDNLLNAGVYTVTVKLPESDHYLATEATTTVTVLQTSVDLPSDFTATFEDTLGSLVLPTSEYGVWTWKTGNDTLVGTVSDRPNVHVAVFTSTNSNYISFEHNINVTVRAKELIITVLDSEYTYDGNAHMVSYKITDVNGVLYSNEDITVNNSDKQRTNYGVDTFVLEVNENNYYSTQVLVSLTINKFIVTRPTADATVFNYNETEQTYNILASDYYTVSNNIKTNAGTYTVYVALNDTTNYIWDNETSTRLLFDFVINRVEYQIELPSNLTATYGDVLGTVQLPQTTEGTWRWNDRSALVGNAGSNNFAATFYVTEAEGVDNYIDTEYTITITVNKQVVSNPGDITNRVYTGSDLKPTIVIPNEYVGIYELTQNLEAINVGQYSVIYTLIDSNNYKWETNDLAQYVVTYDVIMAQSEISNLTIEGWTYLDTPNSPSINGIFIENVVFTYSVDGINFYPLEQMVFNAGTYYVKATIVDTLNYYGDENVVEFTVLKKEVIVPTINSVVYDGNVHTADIADTELYTVTENNGGVETGNYNVILTLVDSVNYKWSTTNEADLTLQFVIVSTTENDWTQSPVVETSYVFGQFTSIGSASALFGNVIIEYKLITNTEYTTLMPTEVGRYIIRFSVEETENYNGLAPVELTFEIVKDQVEKPETYNEKYTYDGTEHEYVITENEHYSVSGNFQTEAGEYTVTVSLNNPAGYEWTDGTTADLTFTFVIEKQTVTAPSDKTSVYTGEEISDDILENELYTFESISKTDVGIYSIEVTLKDSNNYTWDTTTESVHVVTLTITIATTEITNFVVEDVTYGEEFAPVASTNFGNVEFLYSTSENGEFTSTKPQNAGKYYIKAVVEGNVNYTDATSDIIIANINKQKIDMPLTDDSEFVYTGLELTYVIAESEYYTVENNKYTNVGTYAVSVELTDSSNYAWSTGSSDALSYEFVIKQATTEWTVAPTITGWTYGEEGVAVSATSSFGNIVVEYKKTSSDDSTYSQTLPTEAGQYTARFKVEETNNYSELIETIEFTIAKADVTVPTINSVVYDGNVHTADITATDLYEVTENNGGTNVGTYHVVLTLTDFTNYKWNGFETESITLDFNITKANAEISNLTITGWSYLDQANAPYAETTFGTIEFTYIINGENSVSAPTVPGTYKVVATVESTDNFDGDVEEFEFTITKYIVTVPTVSSMSYTGETLTSGLTNNDFYTVEDEGGIDKGEYVAKLTLTNTNLYQWSSDKDAETVEVKYNIVAEHNEWTTEPSVNSEITYGETLTLSADAKFGDVVIEYKLASASDATYTTTMPTNAGDYIVRFSVAADDAGSYGALLETRTLKIKKAQVAIPEKDSTEFVYTGEQLTYVIVANDNYTVAGNVQTNANEEGYIVTVTLNDDANYEWSDATVVAKTYTFIIKKASYTPSGVATANAVYAQKLYDVNIIYTATDGTWAWINNDTLVGNAGLNEHTALFTPTNTNYAASEQNVIVQVEQADNNFTKELSITGWTYGETAKNPTATSTFGTVVYTYSTSENGEYSATVPTNAGIYYVKATVVETSNYAGLETVKEFTISKANPTITWPSNLSAQWGQQLSSISLSEGFAWGKDIVLPKTIGTYQYEMVYTPEDTNNYNVLTQNISVTINKKVVTTSVTNQEFVYEVNNLGFDLGINHNNDDSNANLVVTYQYCAEELGQYVDYSGAIINAGYYKVILNMEETNFYQAVENIEYTVFVDKAKEVIFDEKDAEYNNTIESYLPTSEYGVWTAVIKQEVAAISDETVLSGLGEIIILATFTPYEQYAANFATYTKEITLNVQARTLTIEVTENSFVYNTNNQVLEYKVYDNGTLVDLNAYGITISGNDGIVNVGSKEFTLTVTGNELYRGTITATLTITKATVTVPTIESKVYNKTNQTADIVASNLYEVTENNGGTNVGTYEVALSLKDHANYKWSTANENNDPQTITLTFTIIKATFDMTNVKWNYSNALTYTGTSHKVMLENLPEGLTPTYTNNEKTNVGNYTAIVSFEYDEDNYNKVTFENLTWAIIKANVNITNLNINGWTYGDSAKTPTANTNFGDIVFTYSTSENGEYTTTVPTAAGTYYVKASVNGTTNYNAGEAINSFVIAKKDVTIDWTYNQSYTYTGSTFATPIARVTKVDSTTIELTVNETNSKTFKNAGDYTFNAILDTDLSNNYSVAQTSINITVNKANLEFEYENTYNTTWNSTLKLSDFSISTIQVGTITLTGNWKQPETALEVGSNQEFVIVYTPSDTTNYNLQEVTVYVSIQKITSTINSEDSYEHYYNGTNFNVGATTNNVEAQITYTYQLNGVNVDAILGVGSYTVIINVAETAHYSSATKTIEVVVRKGTITVNTKPTFNVEVLKSLADITLPTVLEGHAGTFVWMDGEEVISDLSQIKFNSAGENDSYSLLFTASDSNYNTVSISAVVITVNRIQTSVSSLNPELSYNGSQFSAETMSTWFTTNSTAPIVAICTGGTNMENQSVSIMKDAGTYQITVTISESDLYTAYSATFEITVKQGRINPTGTATASSPYGQTLSQVSITYDGFDGTFEWQNANSLVGNVGTNTFTAAFTPKDKNYLAAQESYEINVVVSKATTEITEFNAIDKVYTVTPSTTATATSNVGNDVITFVYSTEENGTYTTDIPVNVGTYWVKAVVAETANYTAAETNYAISYQITPATPTITWPIYSGTYYEDRVNPATDYTTAPSANTGGEFTYSTAVYGTNSIQVTFTPSDTHNYISTSSSVTINIAPVAYNSDGINFGTIETALLNTDSGTVTIIPGTNPIIRENCEIKSGVLLFIPYSSALSSRTTDGKAEFYMGTESSPSVDSGATSGAVIDGNSFAINNPTRLKSTLTINNGITLTNNGNIEISGQICSGGGGQLAAGHTYGLYSQILLKKDSKIKSNGNIYCYGHILEDELNNGSMVEALSGNIYMPFVMFDFRGGSIMYGLNSASTNYRASAFNQFNFINITAKIKVNYSSSIIGWANLYAGDQHNNTSAAFIGSSDKAVFQFTSEEYSYANYKYNPETEVTKIDFYGGMQTNKMELKIKVLFSTMTIDTEDVYFPISWRLNLTYNQHELQTEVAEYNMNQRFKLMTGASLKVNVGAKLTVTDLIIYSDFVDSTVFAVKYPDKEPAEFIVNGEFIATNFAGSIYTETESGAIITITGETNITAYEPEASEGSSIATKITKWIEIIEETKIYLYDGTNNNKELSTITKGTYYSKDGCWFNSKITITYNKYNGESYSKTHTIGANGLISSDLDDINRKGYTFDGWYLDSERQSKVDSPIFYDISVYDKWSADVYNLEYNITKDENVSDYQFPSDITTQFTIEDTITLYKLVSDVYYFDGWYSDSELEKYIGEFNFDTLTALATEDKVITLYAHWLSEFYVVNYELNGNPNGLDLKPNDSVTNKVQSFTPQDASFGDSNQSLQYYFVGWYLEESFTTRIDTISITDLETYIVDNQVTLYALWGQKYSIQYQDINGNNIGNPIYANYEGIAENDLISIKLNECIESVWSTTSDYISLQTYSWSIDGSGSYAEGYEFIPTANTIIKQQNETLYKYYKFTVTETNATVTISTPNGSHIISEAGGEYYNSSNDNTVFVLAGQKVNITVKYTESKDKKLVVKQGSTSLYNGSGTSHSIDSVAESTYSISAESKSSGGCFAEGTLITLADGSQKKVEEITPNDYILGWDFETGSYVAVPVLLNVYHGTYETDIINLVFDDGRHIEVILEHGFFDKTLNMWVHIDETNYMNYIEHMFVVEDENLTSYATLKLVDAYITTKTVGVYGPVAAYTINCYANGVLSIVPATGVMDYTLYGLFHYFEVGENLQYDIEKIDSEIETYGLYTYEEWKEYVTEYEFEALNIKYLKVSVGKGLVTVEEIIKSLETYFPKTK